MVMSRTADQVGRVLSGRYRLVAPVGTGASAQVYLADDVRLRRRVAVKLLHAALADDQTFLRRFRAEAQAAAALNHPNVLAVYDWGEDEGSPYLVTEYLSGGSVRTMLDSGVLLTPSQALLVGLEATRALEYAHRRGFVHRDIKPANLLFGEDGRLRVADFGLARALAEAAWTEPQGAVLGTARYASPEQALGEAVDGRADVYSLGLVLIEAVTGSVPFAADTTISTLMARVGKQVEVPAALGPLRGALERAGRPDPAERAGAGELAVSLMAVAGDLPKPQPLPLAGGGPSLDSLVADDRDPTMIGAPERSDDSTRVEGPGDRTLAVPAPAGGPSRPQAPPVVFDDGLDDEDPPSRRRWPLVAVVVLLAALIGGGGAWAYVSSQVPTYEVPELEGKSEQEALELIARYGWEVERVEGRADGSVPGMVLSTDPAAGELLREGGTLRMVVSLGNELAAVPTDLVGLTLDDARARLAEAGGFTAEVVEEVFDEVVPAGVVTAIGPDVPGELPRESAVPLVVSKGPPPRTIPDGLAGGTFEQAAAALAEEQLQATKVEEFSDDVEAGTVIGTRPAAGEQVPRDSTVEVVVSKGPDLVTVPSVAGMDLDQAVAALESAGLTVGDAFGPAKGNPFETDPPGGSEVRRGSTVDIYLRR